MSYRKVLQRRTNKIRRNIYKMKKKGFVFETPCYTPNVKLYTHLQKTLERKKRAREEQLQNEKRKRENN
jgi:H2-forming N5,N10-methylenetetrahydromethanopterin dehydrogenase-like enzyme